MKFICANLSLADESQYPLCLSLLEKTLTAVIPKMKWPGRNKPGWTQEKPGMTTRQERENGLSLVRWSACEVPSIKPP